MDRRPLNGFVGLLTDQFLVPKSQVRNVRSFIQTIVRAAALVDWTNARAAAKFLRLAGVVILADFPRNVAGKTLKCEIRKRFLAVRPE